MREQPGTQEELPPEIREFMIDKLAEILVWDYRKPPVSLFLQTERHHRSEVNHDTSGVVRTVFIRRAAGGEGDDAVTMHRRYHFERTMGSTLHMAGRFRTRILNGQGLRNSVTGLLWLIGVAGCGAVLTSIPALDSPDGRIFAQRCGGCHEGAPVRGHGVPDPRRRTMAEWQEVLPQMDRLMHERGLAPLTQQDREAIIRYLRHHAKS